MELGIGPALGRDRGQQVAHPLPDAGLFGRLPIRRAEPLIHLLHEMIEDRQQDVFLGREVVGELAAAHAGTLLDLRQRQALQSLFGNDGHRRLDDLLAANAGDVDARLLHEFSSVGSDLRTESADGIWSVWLDRSIYI